MLRVVSQILYGQECSHRLTDEHAISNVEMVEQGSVVVCHNGRTDPITTYRRPAVASLIKGDNAVSGSDQSLCHQIPAQR